MDWGFKGERTIRSGGASSSRVECTRRLWHQWSSNAAGTGFHLKRFRLLFVLLILSFAPSARAGEIQVDAGTAMLGSSWRGDFAAGGLVRLGYRFARFLSIDTVIWEQLATVDSRFDTGLTIGVTGFIPLKRVRPSLRIFAIHQHEEGAVSVAQTPAGLLFGVGSGIRHRAGGGLTLGVEIPFHKSKALEWVVIPELEGIWFPDPLGPTFYFGGNVSIGFNYSLAKMP